jgi:histidinol-phosphatase
VNADARERYLRAIDATVAAGKLALGYFDTNLTVEWKENETPVTVADRNAELLLRDQILKHFPNDSFLGEEFPETVGTSGFRWIVDPIDGTRSFVRGIPIWGTLVGLEFNGDPVAGTCYMPAYGGIMYRGLRGDGAYRDDRRIHVSTVNTLPDSQVFYSSISWFVKGGAKEAFVDLVGKTQRQRGYGDFYGFMLVAQGSGEYMVEYGVSPWDVAALVPIIEEAGGTFTDWDGNRTIHRPDVLASNSILHRQGLEILRVGRGADFAPGVLQNKKHVT